ncbi:MAG: NAD(P)/FAD-dependent oxidoreductase, partial [Verrucomicrobiota bacterium]|nr:NAD(P)/FAD-dependent oxidoreductase [Verrucomicrobiota bacterium]
TPFVESSFVEQSGAFEFAKQAAGPAGSEAAANSAYEGNYVQLIDINPRMGGQPKDSSRVENQYAAPRLGITGSMMARESIMRSRLLGVKVRAGVGMRQLRWNPDTKRVEIQLTDRSWVRPRAVVLATGIKFTAMTQLGAKKHVINGNGMELLRRAGQGEAIVVGGGNSASQAAIAAAENGAHVTLISRSPLKKSMSDIPALAS